MILNVFRSKKKFIFVLLTSLLLGIFIFLTNSKPTSSEKNGEITPTVFVHGFKGGPGTFNTMMNRLEQQNVGSKRMVAYVSRQGHVTLSGSLPPSMEPFIQVLFENDRASLNQQTTWLQEVFHRLKERHGIQQINLVGHSMGGLAATNFLLHYQKDQYPAVQKLAVIASPYKGINKEGYFEVHSGPAANDLKPDSDALNSMLSRKEFFPEGVDTLVIAGVINPSEVESEHWDGLVHASSVKGMKSIVPFGSYEEAIVFGKSATHSGLHEHPEVDQLLGEFLWRQPNE
ncbi:alpha/beta fold hydrolase [Halobacillus sp. K22]|uniref:alpha/beta fold hydrolase n=1 Tax=Halobacillus sp. K22 TaxID=3457431 RepID=UPI003FCC3BB2